MKREKDDYEIIVWCEGQSWGERFENQIDETVSRAMRCVSQGTSLILYRDNDTVVFGPGKITKIQITDPEIT